MYGVVKEINESKSVCLCVERQMTDECDYSDSENVFCIYSGGKTRVLDGPPPLTLPYHTNCPLERVITQNPTVNKYIAHPLNE